MYKEKEILIFDALISLYGEGYELSDIIVSQIAKKAGVGKGTIYEYFSSKEEIVSKAIVYSFNSKLEDLRVLLTIELTFEEKIRAMFSAVKEQFANKNGVLSFLFNAVVINKSSYLKGEDIEKLGEIKELGMQELLRLYYQGVSDGVIKTCENKGYLKMCFRGVVVSFVSTLCCDDEDKDIVDNAYAMILKLFN